jgi:esterase/lipase superfamily enzyme
VDNLSFGVAQVRVPDNHSEGNVERPWTFTFVTLNLYTAKEDPKNHFIVRAVKEVDDQQFVDIVKSYGKDTAILFVHGYNNSFEDGIFRLAQIVFDGQLFDVVPVLFSWPSRNNVLAYRYDEDSADLSAEYLLDVLNLLQTKAHIKTVHIIAHSMGNRIVLNALDRAANWLKHRPLGELVFAAADIDRKRFTQLAETVQQVAHGMTLYASADDEALWWSGEISSEMPRAGTVTKDGPVIVKGVESIDMTAANRSSLAQNLLDLDPLGLNTHNSFVSPVIVDIARLVLKGEHPPNSRTSSIHSVPEGAQSPRYWRYVN